MIASGYSSPNTMAVLRSCAMAVSRWIVVIALSAGQMERHEQQVDELDADERDDDAAEAVDEQVALQDGERADAACSFTPRSASGISATMMSALKMTAAQDGAVGRVQVHDVERRSWRERRP